ncbi:TetR/AcrR family transcriptional regulator [Microbacterium sp. PMB16]|uniref:TetR/AcrR family transcriptional regulator n=1 Tax=Microbacterium sp. PMB16 TaxID=3120157 RepID=UPI003F4C0B5A
MPRLADHAQRRRQLTDATRRIISDRGLDAATFRNVAQEAGVSIRLIQYYFGDKRELLNHTLRAVIMDASERFDEELGGLSTDADGSSRVIRILQSLIPDDAVKQQDAVVLLAFHAASVSTQAISAEQTTAPMSALETLLKQELARSRGDVEEDADAIDDARMLSMSVAGMVQAVLAAHISPQGARGLVERLVSMTMAV